MSSAADRFVRARRAIRTGARPHPGPTPPDVWQSTLMAQDLVRRTEPEQLIPLWVAREWASAAAGSALRALQCQPQEVQRALEALRGYYCTVDGDRRLGPFESLAQARDAGRAALQHGATSYDAEAILDNEAVLTRIV